MSLRWRALQSAGRVAALMGGCLWAAFAHAAPNGDWEAATFSRSPDDAAGAQPAAATTPEAGTVIRIKPGATTQPASVAASSNAPTAANESLRVQWSIGPAEAVADKPGVSELTNRPAAEPSQTTKPSAGTERDNDLLDALTKMPAVPAPVPAKLAPAQVSPSQGEIVLRARPVATVIPKTAPSPRITEAFPGFDEPDREPSSPAVADTTSRRTEAAVSPTPESPSNNVFASPQPSLAPAAPLSDYSLPPRRFATVDAQQLADRLETARLAMQPARDDSQDERSGNDSMPLPPTPGEPAFQSAETEPPPGDAATGDAAAGEDTIAGAEQLGDEPVDNRLQFLRFDTVLLNPGEWQWDIGLVYAFEQNDFPIVVIDGLGNVVDVVEGQTRNRELFVPIGARYGLNRRTQLFAAMPIGWANSELSFTGSDEYDNDGGIGDITFGATFLLNSNECRDVTFTLAGTAPTGGDPFDDDLAFAAASLGDGFWAISGDFTFIRTYDPIVVFTTIGTRHYFEREHEGAEILPGSEYRWSLGVGFAASSKVTLSARFAAAFVEETEVNGDEIDGTLTEPMSVRLAATIAQCDRWFEPFVEFGTNEDSNVTVFGAIYTY